METVVLEKTIVKIGSLLALGFGEAGGEIIGTNIKGNESNGLNAMIPGKKVEAVFAYVDIRNFSVATDVLEDQVMVFVNRVAGILHSVVHEFFGSPNQNIGDAFLLIWRLTGYEKVHQQRLTDCAALSFVKVMATISKSALLAEYRSNPKILVRVPNYRVRVAFGIHSGWAIEGAIGSDFKIDASYLSPNVNMASRLQHFTKVYGTSVIISEDLFSLLSEPVSKLCRLVDRVAVPGADPLSLFTIDLDDTALEVVQVRETRRDRARQRIEKNKRRHQRWAQDFSMADFVENDNDIFLMRRMITPQFFETYHQAVISYMAGRWEEACLGLQETRMVTKDLEDGPSTSLMRYMNSHRMQAPPDWPGYRIYPNM